MKDVWEASKLKSCSELAQWKDSITNMLWWSFATASKIWKIIFFSCDLINKNIREWGGFERKDMLNTPLLLKPSQV